MQTEALLLQYCLQMSQDKDDKAVAAHTTSRVRNFLSAFAASVLLLAHTLEKVADLIYALHKNGKKSEASFPHVRAHVAKKPI